MRPRDGDLPLDPLRCRLNAADYLGINAQLLRDSNQTGGNLSGRDIELHAMAHVEHLEVRRARGRDGGRVEKW